MAYSEAQKKATERYRRKNLSDIVFRVPKDDKPAFKTLCKDNNTTMNAYLGKVVSEALKRGTLNFNIYSGDQNDISDTMTKKQEENK